MEGVDDAGSPGRGQEPVRPEDLRAGDADRELVLDRLRVAQAEGRLDLEEFEERVTATLAARTYGDLGALTADLPGPPPAPRPLGVPAPRPPVSPPAPAPRSDMRAAITGWAGVSVTTFAIWAVIGIATGDFGHPWWIWAAGPWGTVLLVSWLAGRPTDR